MPDIIHFENHFAKLDAEQDLVLTPNERLSRFIRDAYSEYQAAQSNLAFVSVTANSYQSWLVRQWQALTSHREHPSAGLSLLSVQQEFLVWQALLEAHPETSALLNLSATAQAAADAWLLVHEWRLDITSLKDSQHLQSHLLFREWSYEFQQWCSENDALSRAQLPAVIEQAIVQRQLTAPRCVFLYGFDEHSPAMQALLNAMQKRGSKIDDMTLDMQAGHVKRFACADPQSELLSVAWWSYRLLQQQPNSRIGVVVPDLTARRAQVVRSFNAVFEPSVIEPQAATHAPGFNLSAGQPLASVPLAKAALAALQLNQHQQTLDDTSNLLLSPFLGLHSELPVRAQLDVNLRDRDELQVGRQLLITCAAEFCDTEQQPLCPNFYQGLKRFDQIAKLHTNKRYLTSEWLKVFTEQLQCLGWPGERSLDTLEYQQLQAWQETLNEFNSLDLAVAALSLSDALSVLRRCLQQNSFQAQTRKSPLQILGILEAAGLPFDYLWVTGLDDETWPPAPSPNPLLPLSLQVSNNAPQSSAEREALYASRHTQRWYESARHLVFSHAVVKDDKQRLPSPLIQSLDCSEFDINTEPALAQLQLQHSKLEVLTDNFGGAVREPQAIKGGSSILRDMAACPFQAFARHRLHASTIADIDIGLNAAERGNLVHHALEIVWRKLLDSKRLQNCDDTQLQKIVSAAIRAALAGIRHKNFIGYRFVELETLRLQALVFEWLQLEKQRAPFKVVFNESRRQLQLGGLPLTIRYDRVDLLEDGSLFVIDYKTGISHINAWEGERPDQPQVPLYAIANRDKVVGAAFAQINNREVVLKGLSENTEIAPGIKDPRDEKNLDLPKNWPEILAHWQSTLESLASEFLAGKAAVDPKVAATTCRYCELRGFCRIRETVRENGEGNQ